MQIGLLRVYADEYAGRHRRSRKKGRSKAPGVYQLKVTLGGFDPPIWRRLLVSGDTTLGDLHWILQLGMGWTHSHLHLFEIDGALYSDPSFDLDEAPDEFGDEFRARLDCVVGGEGAQFLYEYDFGDSWRHEIEVEKILPVVPRRDLSEDSSTASAPAHRKIAEASEATQIFSKRSATRIIPSMSSRLNGSGDISIRSGLMSRASIGC